MITIWRLLDTWRRFSFLIWATATLSETWCDLWTWRMNCSWIQIGLWRAPFLKFFVSWRETCRVFGSALICKQLRRVCHFRTEFCQVFPSQSNLIDIEMLAKISHWGVLRLINIGSWWGCNQTNRGFLKVIFACSSWGLSYIWWILTQVGASSCDKGAKRWH